MNKTAEQKRVVPWKNVYNEYQHPGKTDEEIEQKYGMSDLQLDRLVFTNHHEYATVMEEHAKINIRNSIAHTTFHL